MTYWTEFPLVPRIPRVPEAGGDRRLNVIAALVILALAVGLALAPGVVGSSPSGPETASYDD
jgi:hypothetical protein